MSTVPYNLPLIEKATDNVSDLASDINALALTTNTVLGGVDQKATDAASAAASASWFKGVLPAGTNAYTVLGNGLWSIPTPLAVDGITNLPVDAEPGMLESRRLGSGLTLITYYETESRFATFRATAGPSGVVKEWVRVSRDTDTRKAMTPLTLPASANLNETIPAVHVRWPVRIPANVSRWRVLLRNYNDRASVTYTGALTITGMFVGEHAVAADGSLTGQFRSAPTQITTLPSTNPDGSIYGSEWVETPLGARVEYLISLGYTSAAGQVNHVGYGGCWRSTTPSDASAVAPAQTQSSTSPLDVVIEMEVPGSTPVYAYGGDSLTVGVGSTFPVRDSYATKHAHAHGAIPVILAASGTGMAEWANAGSWKWGKVAFTGTTPDAVLWAMGSNDIFGGADLATMQSRFAAVAPIIRDKLSKNVYLATIMPRNTVGEVASHESTRVAYNEWLQTALPGGARMVFDFAASVADPADSSNVDPFWLAPSDTTHLNSGGYARNAVAITQPFRGPSGQDGAPGRDGSSSLTLTEDPDNPGLYLTGA